MYNKVILVGNLTRDIELHYAQSGTGIAKTAIATSRKFTSNGEKKEEVCFVDITFFGRSAEVANQYLRKGSKILVEGRLQFEQWVDQSGGKRSKHSVIVETMQMLDSRADAPATSNNDYPQNQAYNAPRQQNSAYERPQPSAYNAPSREPNVAPTRMPENNLPEIDIDEDEIPF
jgi:single-strand DNA-binding protein